MWSSAFSRHSSALSLSQQHCSPRAISSPIHFSFSLPLPVSHVSRAPPIQPLSFSTPDTDTTHERQPLLEAKYYPRAICLRNILWIQASWCKPYHAQKTKFAGYVMQAVAYRMWKFGSIWHQRCRYTEGSLRDCFIGTPCTSKTQTTSKNYANKKQCQKTVGGVFKGAWRGFKSSLDPINERFATSMGF